MASEISEKISLQKNKRARYIAPLQRKMARAGRSGLRCFFFDADFDLRGDFAENFDGHRRLPDDLDRLRKLHLALVNFESLRRQSFGDVRGRDRAEHLIVLAGFARELQRDKIQQLGLLLRGFDLRGRFLRQRGANALDGLQVAFGSFDSKLPRQQIIARVAGLDGDDVATMSQLVDVLLKNDLHFVSLSS